MNEAELYYAVLARTRTDKNGSRLRRFTDQSFVPQKPEFAELLNYLCAHNSRLEQVTFNYLSDG